MTPVVAQKATAEIPQDELLDVGIRLFDPNIPADPAEQEKRLVFPDVRKAESRYMPVLLRDTLEGTGQWGQVRVLPGASAGSDVIVDGRILESNGSVLKLAIKATDATGRVWLQKDYAGAADLRAYKDVPVQAARPVRQRLRDDRQRPARGPQRAHARAARAGAPGGRPAFRRRPRAVRLRFLPGARRAQGHLHGRAPAGGGRPGRAAHGARARARLRAGRHAQRALHELRREHRRRVRQLAQVLARGTRGRGRGQAQGADAPAARRGRGRSAACSRPRTPAAAPGRRRRRPPCSAACTPSRAGSTCVPRSRCTASR